jgi:hypothetical protein
VTAAELASAGLAAGVLQTRDVLDVTASLREPGRKDVEVIVDEDLYVEVWVLESAGRYRRAGHLGHPAGAGRDHRSVMTSPC